MNTNNPYKEQNQYLKNALYAVMYEEYDGNPTNIEDTIKRTLKGEFDEHALTAIAKCKEEAQ